MISCLHLKCSHLANGWFCVLGAAATAFILYIYLFFSVCLSIFFSYSFFRIFFSFIKRHSINSYNPIRSLLLVFALYIHTAEFLPRKSPLREWTVRPSYSTDNGFFIESQSIPFSGSCSSLWRKKTRIILLSGNWLTKKWTKENCWK